MSLPVVVGAVVDEPVPYDQPPVGRDGVYLAGLAELPDGPDYTTVRVVVIDQVRQFPVADGPVLAERLSHVVGGEPLAEPVGQPLSDELPVGTIKTVGGDIGRRQQGGVPGRGASPLAHIGYWSRPHVILLFSRGGGGLHKARRTPVLNPPTGTPFYHMSAPVVDRAIQRFYWRREVTDAPARRIGFRECIWNEISEEPVIYVDGEPLAKYAGEQVDGLRIESDGHAGDEYPALAS